MYILQPPEIISLPIVDSEQRFPVNRVFCLGRNYYWKAGQDEERVPLYFFMKPSSAVIDAQGEVNYPSNTDDFCHEVELVVAIAKDGEHIQPDQVDDHILGYAIGLDMTRRDVQKEAKAAGQSWESAKAFDQSAPISAITLKEKVGDIQNGEIELRVNGQSRQKDRISSQMWNIREAIVMLSSFQKLKAGDLIMTGTPKGVDRLSPGDKIQASITGLGEIEVNVKTVEQI